MSISVTRKMDSTIIKIESKSLTRDVATELKDKAVEIIDSGEMNLALDLSEPEYIDSSGIGKLLFMNKKMEMLKGTFSIMSINSTLYEFLDSLAITKVIKVAEAK